MPSFSEVMGAIIGAILLAVASGHGDLVWKTIGEVRYAALVNTRADWGCPSFTPGACASYDSRRYR